jgi:DNA segregation ATPase FtsK/SpoIIIE-like protein
MALPELPVIAPDALFDPRLLGGVVVVLAAFTLIALFSPGGSLTHSWAAGVVRLAGWAAAPWAAVLLAGGTALTQGRRALRAAVAGRIAGAALLCLATGALHQIVAAPPAPGLSPAAVVGNPPGADGQVGLIFGAAMASGFGIPGAVAALLVVAAAGFGLLCGWRATTWHRLALGIASAAAYVAAFGQWLIDVTWVACLRFGDLVVFLTRNLAAGVSRSARRYRAWRIRRAVRRAERLAARQALQLAAPEVGQPAPFIDPALSTNRLVPAAAVDPPAPQASPAAPPAAPTGGITVAAPKPASASPVTVSPPERPARWELPSTSMLSTITAQQVSEAEMIEKARLIERTLGAFNVPVTVKEWRVGPTVTQFSLKPDEGVSVKKIKQFEADLQLVLAAKTLRIELPVPGRPVVGIEIPNSGIATVGLREVLEAPQFLDSKGKLRLALGRDVDGIPRVGDLARMPHLLIAGQTGSGKSGCVNSIIASLLYQATPDELNLLMIDPKMVEMAEYEGIPHLRYPVVVDLAEAGKVLLWACEEMERRYKIMAEAGFRNIDTYNKSLATAPHDPAKPPAKPFPFLVIIIDELADLMMFAPDDVEPAICRLTAKARAVGIHLVVATQRPSVDVVTGLIKANMPSRIAFAVSSQIDSRVILDMAGAEALLGRGDMLYLPYDQGKPLRVQGTWVTDEEISQLVHHWKKQGSPQYVQKEEIDALTLKQEGGDEKGEDKHSPLMERAIALIEHTNYVSVSYLGRKLGVGYPRAARVMDDLEERGLVEMDEAHGRSYRVVQSALKEREEVAVE